MAATLTASGTNGYVDPLRGLYTGVIVAANDFLTDGTLVQNRNAFTTEIQHYTAIEDDDTVATGIPGIKAVFFAADQGQDVDDAKSVQLDATDGTIRFKGSGTGEGWVLFFIDPAVSHRSGYPGR